KTNGYGESLLLDVNGRKFLQGALCDQLMRMVTLACSPEAFQIVKLTRPCGEDVHDEVDVIQKDPIAFRVPFDVQRPHTVFLKGFFDVVCNGLIVTRGGSGTNEKVIGEGANLDKLHRHRIL